MTSQRLAAVVFTAVCFTAPLRADLTIKTITKSSGLQGTGASEGANTHVVQGTKARDDNQFTFTGKAMKFMTGGEKNGTQIIRVDLDKLWRLDLKRKTYTEETISEIVMRHRPKQADQPEKTAEPAPTDEKPTHRIKKTDVSVKKTGAKKTINGFPTEETEARLMVDVEEIATGEVTSTLMLTRFWMTPLTADLKKAMEEDVKFQKAYLEKMGVAIPPAEREAFGGAGMALLLGVGDKKVTELLTQLKDKTKDLSGYPIVTESEWTVKEDPKAVARREQAKAAEAKEDSPELSADPKNLAGNLLGSFAKKKMKQRQDAPLTGYHEVVSVSVAPADAALFEIPAGFKLKQK